ncbi:MAG: response regulator [bacterium]
MIKVLMVDDHAILREGIKQILEEYSDIEYAGEASYGQQAMDLISKNDYDVVLLDISLPGRSGLEIITQIKNEKPKLPILILSMHPEERYAVRAFKAGAAGYLTKVSAPDELINAIRKVASGRKFVSNSLAEALASYLDSDGDKAPHEKLSDREFQVMNMLASGKTVTQIAEELSLSVTTISTHRAHILEKMNMTNNAEITYYAFKYGLVD